MKKIFLSFLLAWFIWTNFFWFLNTEKIFAVSCSQQTVEQREAWLPCSEDWIKTLEKNQDEIDWWISRKTFRESIMWIVDYFLILLWVLWVVMIIYAWITVVVWWEEKKDDAKKIIFWVIIWFIIIFLSYSIIRFIWWIWWGQDDWVVNIDDWVVNIDDWVVNIDNWNTSLVDNWDQVLVDKNWNPILTPDWKPVYVDDNWNLYAIDDNWNKYLVDKNWNPILTDEWNLTYLESKISIYVWWKEIKSVLRVNVKDSWVKWILFDASKSVLKDWIDIIEYTWEFWDGNTDYYEDSEPVRQFYEHSWNYMLKLSVKWSDNSVLTKKIRVVVQDLTSEIRISPDNIHLWAKISFDWSDSQSSDGKISSYKWTILDSKWSKIKESEEKAFSFTPKKAWSYKVWLIVNNLKWKEDYNEKNFYVNSNKPKAMFNFWRKNTSSPWVLIFDWWSSYDIDWDVLRYSWDFNWDWVYEISRWSNFKPMYSYKEVWDYNVYLKVEDQFWEFDIFNQKISIDSVLNVDFDVDRYASQKWWSISFTPIVPVWVNSILWDFKDWKKETTTWLDKISHTFKESWIYTVKMIAINRDWEENSVIKKIFIWDWEYPVWVFSTFVNWEKVSWKIDMCWEWKDWIEVTRLDKIEVNAKDSVNIDNTNWWLSFTWDFWDWVFAETQVARHSFRMIREECYPIKVSVKDNYSKKVAKLSDTIRVKVVNKVPKIWNLQIIADQNELWEYETPLKVSLKLSNTFDEDWNIVKYKWYYQRPFTEEKLWYVETYSDSVQFLIEADWIKWLTNDYVFNVEVEDNEWGINSIFKEYWEVDKISVKNWETKSLSLDFETSKTQAFVWDQIVFNVKWDLRNKNIKYSWDFNWDEEIDKTVHEKMVEHSFKKAWTYKVELRVKNKWVYERVYKTIYIDDKQENNSDTSTGKNLLDKNIDQKTSSWKIISTNLWIKLKWEWIALTSLNVRVNKYDNGEYEIVAHVSNSDASLYNWELEFQIVKWKWEIPKPKMNAINSIAKTKFIKTWEWIVEIEIFAKDTIYWDLEEKIIIE